MTSRDYLHLALLMWAIAFLMSLSEPLMATLPWYMAAGWFLADARPATGWLSSIRLLMQRSPQEVPR